MPTEFDTDDFIRDLQEFAEAGRGPDDGYTLQDFVDENPRSTCKPIKQARHKLRTLYEHDAVYLQKAATGAELYEDLKIELEEDSKKVLGIMRNMGIQPEIIFATSKTGLIVTRENWYALTEEEHFEWNAAVDEYNATMAN